MVNLPSVPNHILVVKASYLVVATHGRSFWILDDISPLRQLNDEVRQAAAYLFAPRPLTRFASSAGFDRAVLPGKNYAYSGGFILAFRQQEKPGGEKVNKYLDAGQNPPDGIIVHYYLKEKLEGEVTLTILDASGKEIRSFSSEEKKQEQTEEEGASGKEKKDEKKEKKEPRVLKEAGAHHFVWDTRYPDPIKIEGYELSAGALEGPLAPPGTYRVQLKVGDQVYTNVFEIHADPRITATRKDLQARFELLLAIRDKVSETHNTINAVRAIRRQVEEWEQRTREQPVHEAVAAASKQLKQKLSAIEEELFQVKAKDQLDLLDFPIKLSAKLLTLSGAVASADAAPTRQVQQVFQDLSAHLKVQLQLLHELIATDVAAFNKLIRDSSVPAIIPVGQDAARQEA